MQPLTGVSKAIKLRSEIIPIEPGRVIPERKAQLNRERDCFEYRCWQFNLNQMKQIAGFLLAVLFSATLTAQTFNLNGRIVDSENRALASATVALLGSPLGTASNDRGEYKLVGIPQGEQIIVVQHLGFEEVRKTIDFQKDETFDFTLLVQVNEFGEGIEVTATRANELTPITHQDISAKDLEKVNLGQDLPIMLNQTVSMVTTSDAGAGVGYTGMRIRGTDGTGINVTVNGVPLNDPESHGVFWVNMPDFGSSTNSIQIQRGVGTSSNGSAAFGASINLETTAYEKESSVEINNSYGSFNTRKHNVIFNSGLINNYFNFEGRLSYIGSDGYIDRSASDLRSYYLAGGFYGKKLMVKAVTFAGKEITHQAWWGTPQSRLDNDTAAMIAHAYNNGLSDAQTKNLLESGRTYNYYQYDNEIDHYQQDHYQLISAYEFSKYLKLNVTAHYTYGRGYFEQYKTGESYADIGFANPVIGGDTIYEADMIFQRWLKNHFYGGVYALQYSKSNLQLTLGGSYNEYVGGHFGEVVWSQFADQTTIRQRYYSSDSKKSDLSQYLKGQHTWRNLTIYGDAQIRMIDYTSQGIDNDQRPIAINKSYFFFNPKGGLTYKIRNKQLLYASVAQTHREPVRSDFTDANPGSEPRAEQLTNIEMGWSIARKKWSVSANTYLMNYKDQLVLTGAVNDVGSPIRVNVPESYRAGIELSAEVRPYKGFFWKPNATLSQNKIANFTEVLYDYTNGFDVKEIDHGTTDIAFSPNIIVGSALGYETNFGLTVSVLSKYIGQQYLDNTSSTDRMIDAYFVNDLSINYEAPFKKVKRLTFSLLVNNILNEMYSSNGYTYSYIWGDMITENFYYPQAGRNWLLGMKWKF